MKVTLRRTQGYTQLRFEENRLIVLQLPEIPNQ
jgi:hypothetical protein